MQTIVALVLLLFLFIQLLYCFLYELFLRSYQDFAIFFQYAVWRYTQNTKLSIRIWIYLFVTVFASSVLLQILQFLYCNFFIFQDSKRASLTKLRLKKSKNNYSNKNTLFIDIIVSCTWNVRAEQYVNLWILFFSFCSIFQNYLYIIVY